MRFEVFGSVSNFEGENKDGDLWRQGEVPIIEEIGLLVLICVMKSSVVIEEV